MKSDLKGLNPLALSLLSLDTGGKLMISIWGKFFRKAFLCSLGLGLLFSPFELLATHHFPDNILDIPLFDDSNSNKISLSLFNKNLEFSFKYLKDLNTQIRNTLNKIKNTKHSQNKKDLTNEKKRLLKEHQELLNQIKNSLAKIDTLGRDSIDSKDLPNFDKLRETLKEDLEQHEVKTELKNKINSINYKIEQAQIKGKSLSFEELQELQKEITELRNGILNHIESNEKIGDALAEAYKEALNNLTSIEKDLKTPQLNQADNNFSSDNTTQNGLTDSNSENSFSEQNTENKASSHKPNTPLPYNPPSSFSNLYRGNSLLQETNPFRSKNNFESSENTIQTSPQQNRIGETPSISSTRFKDSSTKTSNDPKSLDSTLKPKPSPSKTTLNNSNTNSAFPYLGLKTLNIVNESSSSTQNQTAKQESSINSELNYRFKNSNLKSPPVAYNISPNNSATIPTNSPLQTETGSSPVNINRMNSSNLLPNTANYTFNNDGTFSPITSLPNDNNPQRGLLSLTSPPTETSDFKIMNPKGLEILPKEISPDFKSSDEQVDQFIKSAFINNILVPSDKNKKLSDISELLAPKINKPFLSKSKGVKKPLTIPPSKKAPDNNQNNFLGKMLAWLGIQ